MTTAILAILLHMHRHYELLVEPVPISHLGYTTDLNYNLYRVETIIRELKG